MAVKKVAGRSADAAAGAASAKKRSGDMSDLKKLGDWLGAKDVQGKSSVARKRISEQRKKDFLNKYYTTRGGGQGKKAPSSSSYPPAPKKRPDVRGNVARSKAKTLPKAR